MVLDDEGRLMGSISLVDLIAQEQDTLVSTMMRTPHRVLDTLDIQQAVRMIRSQGWTAAAVVNEDEVLMGQLTAEDVVDVSLDDTESTVMNMVGLNEEEDLFSPIVPSAKRRAFWLGLNLMTAFLAAWVIELFESTLQQVVALAVLMPIVASMGGIAGSQTLTLMIRGMALGKVGGSNK